MDTSKLITFGILGAALLFLWDWLTTSCESPASGLYGSSTCNMLMRTPITGTVPVGTTPVSSTPSQPTAQPATVTLTEQLQAAAGFPTLSADQWSFYYQAIPGKPQISGPQFENILGTLGESDATRGNQITANAFVQALAANGLSGSRVPLAAIHGGY